MSQKKLTKRADGRYKVSYGAKQFYGKTRAEAIKKRDEYIASENIGLNLDFAEMTFLDYGINWLRVYRTECGVSQQKQYAKMVEFTAKQAHEKCHGLGHAGRVQSSKRVFFFPCGEVHVHDPRHFQNCGGRRRADP